MLTTTTEPLRAISTVHSRASHSYSPGRICAEPDCGTRLSVYNRAAYCGVHEEPRPYYVRGTRRSTRARTAGRG